MEPNIFETLGEEIVHTRRQIASTTDKQQRRTAKHKLKQLRRKVALAMQERPTLPGFEVTP